MTDVSVKTIREAMVANKVTIKDGGNAIALTYDTNLVWLNKPQIAIIEVIKNDTVRIEMGNGETGNVYIKVTDVIVPVVADAYALRDALGAMLASVPSENGDGGDCACAPLIEATNTELQNVTAAVTQGNAKIEQTKQVLSDIYNNGVVINQAVLDSSAANTQKLNEVLNETIKVTANTGIAGNRLDNIMQSTAGTATNIQSTNQILADNQVAVLQSLASLKSEILNLNAKVTAGNDQLSQVNQANASIVTNGTNGNQTLTSLDSKFGNNAYLGNISRKLKTVTVQPAISTVAYAVGQVIGGVMTLTGALRAAIMSGTWMGVQVVEKSTQKAPMDIVLFTSNPTAANFADKAVPIWTNDYDKIIGITNVVAANYSTLSTSSGVCLGNLCKRVTSTTGNLYAIAICNGTPTYASVSHLYFTFYFEQD
ncbi:MAG: hypothetical protein JSS82_13255 [Bacteroidetes bacterium]|nr:hypothetical protein [Bacteroidota bacterium]